MFTVLETTLIMGKGYGQHQRLCVTTVHHECRVDA